MPMSGVEKWLAPLRGVTIRAFRDTFHRELIEAGFRGAFAPFIPANPGIRITESFLKDLDGAHDDFPLVPQVIGKHPEAMRTFLRAIKERGFVKADLNAGCPFPMIIRKNRGSGIMKTPDVLEAMLAVGVEEMGEGNFSLKIRLGVANTDEVLALLPIINKYPLSCLTVHARTAKQMYAGGVDLDAFEKVLENSVNPVMYNGDVDSALPLEEFTARFPMVRSIMIGRGFIISLGRRDDARELALRYVENNCKELAGDHQVLGRMKEFLAYWSHLPRWERRWNMIKICRSVDELVSVL